MSENIVQLNTKVVDYVKSARKLFINGQFVDSVSGETFDTFDPATGNKIVSVAEANAEDVEKAVEAARDAFDSGDWPKMKPNDRARLLLKLADLIEENAEELSHLETLDNGMPLNQSYQMILGAAESFRYYAGWATKIAGETLNPSTPGEYFTYTRKEPVGVAGAIIPWNGPLTMASWKLAAPLAVGCTVILKPAENTPLTALRLAELIQEAEFPDGVVNIIPGMGSVAGQAMTEHPQIDKIAFTGSTAVGKKIMASSAVNVKKVSLELGGKSAHIVFADADYDKAIANAANAVLMNTGQACIAGSRLFVEDKIYDKFLQDLSDYVQNFKVGSGFDSSTQLGPVISQKQKERILGYLDIGKNEGAELLTGDQGLEADLENGYFVKPTVISNVNNDMRIAKEEIFGPVVSGIPFSDVDEMLKQANDTEYGLGGGVNTTDVKKAHKVAHGLRTGNVWVNTYNLMDPAVPFGGYKQSGLGRENGKESLDMFMETKSVWIDLND